MSFLAPWFLAGAALVAAPIIFHLIRRTVKERVQFSTLMFLKESPPRLTKRSHLENWLLLVIRCVVICLLAASFARPYFQQAATAPPRGAAGRRIVVLLDTSASMRRSGAFEAARRAAGTAVREAEQNDSVAVVAFDTVPRTILTFEQWKQSGAGERVATALARIDAAAATWNSTHLGRALVSAAEMVMDASRADNEGDGRSRLVLVSDLQQGARLDGLQGFVWPRGCEVVLKPIEAPQNAGVQLLAGAPGESLSVTNAKLRVRVVNAAGAKTEQFKLGWAAANGAQLLGSAVELHVPAGQNRSIALPPMPTNVAQLSALLLGDAEQFDNRAYHAAPPRQTVKVTYIGPDKEDDPAGSLFYLKRAFPETAGLAVRVDARPPGGGQVLDAHLAIVTSLVSADAGALKAHLAAGNAALIIAEAGKDLGPLALALGSAPGVIDSTVRDALLARVDFDHPIFSQFRDARFNDFTKIHFWKHRKLDLAALPKARVLAAFEDGAPALVDIPVEEGSLYLLASGWSPGDSQFALSTKFVPFLFSLLELSSPANSQARQLVVGDSLPFPGDATVESITITKPDGTKVDWKKGSQFLVDQPGFYVGSGANLLLAANLDPAESRTSPIEEEQLGSLGLPLKRQEVLISAEAKKERDQLLLATEQESRQKLWRRLLVVALALLLLESIIARLSVSRPLAA